MSNRLRSLLLLCGRRGEHQDIFLRENKKNLRRKKGEEGREKEKPSPAITNYSLQFCGRGQTAESGRTAIESSSVQKGKSRKSDNCSRRRRRRKNRGFRGREEEAATYDFCFPVLFLPFFLKKIFSFISAKAPSSSSSSSSLLFALVQSGNGEEKRRREKYQFVRFGRRQLANWQMPRCPIPFPFSPLTFQQSNLRLSRVHTRTGAPIGRGENR